MRRIHSKERAASEHATEHAPFSRPFMVDRLPADGEAEVHIEANAAERARLAKLDGLIGIESLTADFRITRQGAGGARVRGELAAEVVQTCILTLEPFPARLTEEIDLSFAPDCEVAAAEAALRAEHETGDLVDLPDPPDPIIGGMIDLGAIAAEFLALGLDPYPKKPGAKFATLDSERGSEPTSPFAALEQLRTRKS